MKTCPRCNSSFEDVIAYCPNDGARLPAASRTNTSDEHGGSVLPSAKGSDADLTGRTIAGRYNITRRLGEGGMGVVYAAVDTRLEKPVALKLLKDDFAHRSDVVARFTQEAKSAARIKHENVLDVTDYGQTEEGTFYIAMELLVGTDLAEVLNKNGSVEPKRALAILVQICRAVAAAHGKGVVHRDLKPENVFLVQADDGREVVKIVDFGIAQMKDLADGSTPGKKLTRTGMIFGTPEYMSPEQAAGKDIDHRVDIYAIGVIIYELFAGRVPFVGDSFMGILTQHMFETAPAIHVVRPEAIVPDGLEAIITHALAKNPNERYQTVQAVVEDLQRVRDGALPLVAAAPAPSVPQKPNATGSYGALKDTRPEAPKTVVSGPTMEMSVVTAVASESAPPARRTGLLLGAAGAALLVGGGLVFWLGSSTRNPSDPASVVQPGSPTTGTTGTETPAGGSTATGVAPTTPTTAATAATTATTVIPTVNVNGTADGDAGATGANTVSVQIVSAPLGARIEAEGGGSCEHTPCALDLPRGREVRLVATAARRRGELVVTPEQDGQSVTIELRAPRTVTSRHTGSSGASSAPSGHRCRPGELQWYDRTRELYVPCS